MQVTYSTLIDGCVRENAIETGKELLSEMVAGGVKPNAVTYNTLLRAYAKDDKVEMKVWYCIGVSLCIGVSFLSVCASQSAVRGK